MRSRKDDEEMTGREIAEMDAAEYEEPHRDLQATRPVKGTGPGSIGDEDNPKSEPVAEGKDSARGNVDNIESKNAHPGKLAYTDKT